MQQGGGREEEKKEGTENIGNSYFPALTAPLFALTSPLPEVMEEERRVIAGGDGSRGSENMRRFSLARGNRRALLIR